MGTKIEIVGGSSSVARITILSDEFTSTATYDPKKKHVCCRVRRVARSAQEALRLKSWWIPRSIKFIAFFVASSSPKIGEGVIRTGVTLVAYFSPCWISLIPGLNIDQYDTTLIPTAVLTIVILGCLLWPLLRRIAPWHGAEHMAINAYDGTGLASLDAINSESPYTPRCGGRFALPFIICTAIMWQSHSFIAWLVAFEAMLQIDHFIGWARVPVFAQLEWMAQTYITTRKPEKLRLVTAQLALRGLLEAHRRSS